MQMMRGKRLNRKEAETLIGKFIAFHWPDDRFEHGGSMAGWILKIEEDRSGVWIVTDDGMGIRVQDVDWWEEDISDSLPCMYPYILLDKRCMTLYEPFNPKESWMNWR